MPQDDSILDQLAAALVELEDEAAVELARRGLAAGLEPVDILTSCEKGLTVIGERYAAGEYFISGLIMAGEVMSRITTLVTARLTVPERLQHRGRVLIGTVEGDIHDLGKNIAGALLSAHGFEVLDLGVDVAAEDFVREGRKFKPDLVGLSVLMTACFPALEAAIKNLRKMRGLRNRPLILISGAQVAEEHRRLYQADLQARTAFDTVRLCKDAGC